MCAIFTLKTRFRNYCPLPSILWWGWGVRAQPAPPPPRQPRRSAAMARDLNKVQVTGRLGADPEMRFTPQGHAVTTFRVASNRSWRTPEGESHEETEWFRVVAWNKLGEICNQWLSKGSRVYVEGRLQTRQWQDQDGQTRHLSEVVANDIIILDSRRSADPD